jgi:leader peptidase (prepilin peptidase)/N-methyltransferase
MTGGTETLGWWLSPWVLGLLGLCVGSFLNVVAHRLPRMMERQWWADVAAQLSDADPGSAPSATRPRSRWPPRRRNWSAAWRRWPRVPGPPASRCPSCGHAIRWHENIPLLGWLRLRGRCAACGTRASRRATRWWNWLTGLLFAGWPGAWARSPRCCCGAVWRPPWSP